MGARSLGLVPVRETPNPGSENPKHQTPYTLKPRQCPKNPGAKAPAEGPELFVEELVGLAGISNACSIGTLPTPGVLFRV